MLTVPSTVELHPWEAGGGVGDLELGGLYLGLLRQRFMPLLRRVESKVVLSPYLLSCQRHVWTTLLQEASFKRVQLVSNLDCLASSLPPDVPGMFLHLGSGGGDLGLCLQGETYRYHRLLVGEDDLVKGFARWLTGTVGELVSQDESYRVLKIVVAQGLAFPGGRLVEIGCGEEALSTRVSLEQEVLLQAILDLVRPVFEEVETFVRSLSPRDHSDLFFHGLSLSGGATTLALWRDSLLETFEFPIHLTQSPTEAVLRGA